MHLLGSSLRAGAVTGPPPAGPGTVPWDTRNTDLAFWGNTAIQGRYDGFRVVDIRSPGNPRELAYFSCVSPQGDVGVYGNLVFRSVDSPQLTDRCSSVSQSGSPTGADCAPAPAPCTGFEGIQIFDISDLGDIELVKSVPLDCGSHTHTVVPDPAGNRVLIYNSVSGNTLQPNPGKYGNRCPGPPFGREDIVEVPLDDPASASVIGSFELGEFEGHHIEICHDMGVILGSVNRAACAGHPAVAVFDISDLENPVFLYATHAPTVDRFHSAAWSWDGSVLVTGWEPGGGTQPRCQATGTPLGGGLVQTDEMKTLFFHDGATGEIIGRHVLPRPQSQWENCTIHNYNIVPHPTRNLLVHGSYQSGTALVDFTDPANAYEVAWMDPDPLDPPSAESPGGRTNFRGGDWSSYWYNGLIYESDTRRGLFVWNVSAPEVGGPTVKLDHLNPQTNHLSISAD
ncbi:MAG TPA: hypothetical protein VKA57_10840 [Solirubrobacteraceae bacterium]|nr:hypothetical protein [Solirubrobacteraceae bacterium]